MCKQVLDSLKTDRCDGGNPQAFCSIPYDQMRSGLPDLLNGFDFAVCLSADLQMISSLDEMDVAFLDEGVIVNNHEAGQK